MSDVSTSGWQYNSSNQLTSTPSVTYTYDNNGNTLTKVDSNGTTQYGWDVENRLASVTLPGDGATVSFKYDPFGRRIEKITASGATLYVYDGANIVGEYDGNGALIAKYAQGAGIDEPLAMNRQGSTVYYNADGLGSVTSLDDAGANQTVTYQYDSFGKSAGTTGSLFNPFRYTGREWDQETGLYYYRARYYDRSIGRFISEDPIGFNADQINFYGYVGNSPVSNFDPSGLARCMFVINGGENGGGWFDCVPDNPKNHPVSFPAASGNNGDPQHQCKNNPDCAPNRGTGPIPPGWYQFTGTPGSRKHGGTLLLPIPGSLTDTYGRNGLLTHFCMNPFGPSRNKPFCSEGCITASPANIRALNRLLSAEPNSLLYVTSIAKESQ